jgi:hypothetical protein
VVTMVTGDEEHQRREQVGHGLIEVVAGSSRTATPAGGRR